MGSPWLPDTCVTALRTAEPVVQVVNAWAQKWFKQNPWRVLGGWDEESEPGTDEFQLLGRSRSMEIKMRPGCELSLAMAIIGEENEQISTARDNDVLNGLGAKALSDLETRLSSNLPDLQSQETSQPFNPCTRVFSLLIGALGQAQIAVECSFANLIPMARSTFPISEIDQPILAPAQVCDDVSINVSAFLGSTKINLAQLADLEKGDLLLLDCKPSQTARLMIEEHPTAFTFSIKEDKNSCVLEFQDLT